MFLFIEHHIFLTWYFILHGHDFTEKNVDIEGIYKWYMALKKSFPLQSNGTKEIIKDSKCSNGKKSWLICSINF